MKYTHNKIEFCCEKMMESFTSLRIWAIYEEPLDHPKRGPGLQVEVGYPTEYGFVWKWCPFCGERIEQVESI